MIIDQALGKDVLLFSLCGIVWVFVLSSIHACLVHCGLFGWAKFSHRRNWFPLFMAFLLTFIFAFLVYFKN